MLCNETTLTPEKTSRRRIVKVFSLNGEHTLRLKRIRFFEASPQDSSKRDTKQYQNLNEGVQTTNVEKENISSNILITKADKDHLPSIREEGSLNPQLNTKIQKDSIVEGKPQSKRSLNLQGTRNFVPKSKETPKMKDFMLEFIISSEITLSMKITPDTNPYKMAEYIGKNN
mmetsp:Transcript_16404/g.14325  ORF Transcript_16404/g.14325 Transcript_16404/m.14325 type:complete len:172 (+) Transcript_16404:546-1061(+)